MDIEYEFNHDVLLLYIDGKAVLPEIRCKCGCIIDDVILKPLEVDNAAAHQLLRPLRVLALRQSPLPLPEQLELID